MKSIKEMTKQDLEKDILVLVLRLFGEDHGTFSEETAEVMERWQKKALSVLRAKHVYELGQTPLTKEQILKLNEKHGWFEFGDAQGDVTRAFVKDIEKMHGIG